MTMEKGKSKRTHVGRGAKGKRENQKDTHEKKRKWKKEQLEEHTEKAGKTEKEKTRRTHVERGEDRQRGN